VAALARDRGADWQDPTLRGVRHPPQAASGASAAGNAPTPATRQVAGPTGGPDTRTPPLARVGQTPPGGSFKCADIHSDAGISFLANSETLCQKSKHDLDPGCPPKPKPIGSHQPRPMMFLTHLSRRSQRGDHAPVLHSFILIITHRPGGSSITHHVYVLITSHVHASRKHASRCISSPPLLAACLRRPHPFPSRRTWPTRQSSSPIEIRTHHLLNAPGTVWPPTTAQRIVKAW